MLTRKRRDPIHPRARTTHSSSAQRSSTSACRGHRASPKTLSAPQSRNISRSRRTAFHANNETQIPAHCSGHCHGRSSGGREKISCDAQFHFINDAVLAALAENQPVSSVDTKKKELAVDPVVALGWSYVGPAEATHGRRRARRSRST